MRRTILVWIVGMTFLPTMIIALRCNADSMDFAAHFVPAFDRFHQSGNDADAAALGQLLLTELSCTACHQTPHNHLAPKRGPNLDAAALRLQPAWLRRYLDDPQAAKPGTTMPHALGHLSATDRAATIDALVAYLQTQTAPFAEYTSTGSKPIAVEFWRKGDADRGAALYHEVGCVACHAPDDHYPVASHPPTALEQTLAQLEPDEIAELGLANLARPIASVPLPDLAAKYTDKSLTHFLLAPERARPAGRMPNFRLPPHEAADLTAWLRRRATAESAHEVDSPNPDLVAAGRRHFVQHGCANCHTVNKSTDRAPARPLAELNPAAANSCLDSHPDDTASLPHYTLTDTQRHTLRASLDALASSSTDSHLPPADALHLRLAQANCYACHNRADRGGVGPNRRAYFVVENHVDLGDEGRIPPALDRVGEKLTPAALAQFLNGKLAVRPHMHARMPSFPDHLTQPIAAHLAQLDAPQKNPRSADEVFAASADLERSSLVEAGRQLVNVGCAQCHPLRGEQLPGVVGVDLLGAADRLRPDWLRRFLLNPAALKTNTRMPSFFTDGKSPNADILDGNVSHQLAAIHAYLRELPKARLPDRLEQERLHNFELTPTDRPILLRTYMAAAGTRAIAVGFPAGVHFAFDARRPRLAQIWRGRFLDAHGTWFDRFIPPAQPLGADVVTLPQAVPFAALPDSAAPWPDADDPQPLRFRGYRLDDDGVPTFLYRFHHLDITDRIQPMTIDEPRTPSRQILSRRLTLTVTDRPQPPHPIYFRVHAAEKLDRESPLSVTDPAGLTVMIANNVWTEYLRTDADRSHDWILRVEPQNNPSTIIRYEW